MDRQDPDKQDYENPDDQDKQGFLSQDLNPSNDRDKIDNPPNDPLNRNPTTTSSPFGAHLATPDGKKQSANNLDQMQPDLDAINKIAEEINQSKKNEQIQPKSDTNPQPNSPLPN